MSDKGPVSEACERARQKLGQARSEIADEIAWALQRELRMADTEAECMHDREQLAQAIEDFLR